MRTPLLAALLAFCAPALAPAAELPVPVRVARLANGLRVVLSPAHETPTVAVAVYYDVGARNEAPGRTGFAHLFEHMMFEGSANVPKGEFDRLVARHGASANATTSEDRTNYFETLPANALELGLFLEADRMRALAVDEPALANQRQTVMEERRQSYENEPYALSLLRRDELAYDGYFPYAHPVIGAMDDLARAPLAAVRAFHARYYAPNNAVLTLVGDFDPDRALALVRRHFEAIPRAATPPFRDPGLRPQTAERVATVRDAHAELPAFHLAYHTPPRRTPDFYALEVLATVLGDGDSARLYRSLVRDREVASDVDVTNEERRGPNLFTVFCVLAAGHTPAEVRPLIDREFAAVARAGITPRELESARNRIRAAFVLGLQSNLARAEQLSEFELYDGDAALLRTELDRYLAVTADDVRRVAARYLMPTQRTVLDVLPAGPPGGG